MENFDLDEFMESTEESVEEPVVEDNSDFDDDDDLGSSVEESDDDSEIDLLGAVLQSKGITNGKVLVVNDKNETEEIDFNDLSKEEQLAVLTNNDVNLHNYFTPDELKTIEYLRQQNTDLVTLVKNIKENAIKDYLEQNNSVSYTVDQLSDDELFKYDLKERYPDLTDLEIQEELDQAHLNEELFNKKMGALRKEYKEEEDALDKRLQAEEDAKREQSYNNYVRAAQEYAYSLDSLHNLELSDSDKNEVLRFLLDRDVNGQPEFFKLLNDPASLFNMAWYHLYGDKAFKMVNDYWRNQVSESRRPAPTTRVVNKKNTEKKPSKDYFGLNAYFSDK